MTSPSTWPDLGALEVLLGVAETGSIRQSALRLGISQPAASLRVRHLEEHLGVIVLERTPSGARLTADGAAVVGWAEQVLRAYRVLLSGVRALRASRDSQLRVAASLTVAEYLLPGWLATLHATSPEVSVSLRMANSHDVVELFANEEVDLGFVEGPVLPTGLQGRSVLRDELVIVVAATHAWTRRRSALSPRDVATAPFILRERGSGTRDVFESALARHHLSANVVIELASTTAIKEAVMSGLGPSILSRLAVQSELREGRLREVTCRDLVLERAIRAVWPRHTNLSPVARRLLATVEATVATTA
ncbi:MAG: LysR family transcriptional regulator [Acidobacteriota bacterium]|nr:LysR family transcriptional regulator [Acidobacteriota bacterium]